jgi:hypothetical protein
MPNKLYKYRPFNVWTLRCLTEAEIHYPEPTSFNDPMDCRPTIDVNVDRDKLERLYYRLLLRRMTKDKAAGEVGHLRYMSSEHGDYKTDPKVEDYLIRMLAREIRDEVDDELGKAGVLSLSATWSSVLMWSHYGDQHRGICIEYDTTEQNHPRLAAVNYRAPRAIKASDLIRWKALNDEDARVRVMQTYFYAKSKEWKYEKEWRDLRDKSGSHGVPFRITAIYFGLRCDISIITSIVKLLVDRPAIKLYAIHPKGDTFRLARSLIDREELEAVGVRDPAFIMFKDVVWDDEDLAALLPEPAEDPVALDGEGIAKAGGDG